MSTTFPLRRLVPESHRAMAQFACRADAEATAAGLPVEIRDLVKIRVSQTNGCAFCLRLHTAQALEHGMPPERVRLLPGWRRARDRFTDPERLALEVAEAVTALDPATDFPALRERAGQAFTEAQVAALLMVAVAINAWTRIGIAATMAGPEARA
jgi:AhpD family alkylhydroperoxidase